MGILTASGRNTAVNSVTGAYAYVSLHTGSPGSSGASEVSGGGYARKAVTWGAASAGVATQTGSVTFDVPASTTVTHIGVWSSATGGTFGGFHDITDETFGAAGTGTVSGLTVEIPA